MSPVPTIAVVVVDVGSAAGSDSRLRDDAVVHARDQGRRRSDRILSAVLDLLPTAVVVVDTEGLVLSSNPAAQAMLAVNAGALRVTALLDLVRLAVADGMPHEAVVTLPQRLEPPLRRPRRDRDAPEAKVRAVPLKAEGTVVVLLDDVTEERRVDAVRRDFVANVSHELKTPVGAMHLLAEAIVESPDDPEMVKRFATSMTAQSERLANLVQELIDLSRLQGAEPMEREVVRLDDVAREAVDRVHLAAEAKDISVVPLGEDGLQVLGDERQLVTATTNLLANAVSYSPAGTRVTLGIVRRGAWVEVSVADEGIGIAESDQERVFERFYRVDPARSRATGGTGLGLAIVKHVATNHGGDVTLWSRLEAGSTFTLRLPASGPAGTSRLGRPVSSPLRDQAGMPLRDQAASPQRS